MSFYTDRKKTQKEDVKNTSFYQRRKKVDRPSLPELQKARSIKAQEFDPTPETVPSPAETLRTIATTDRRKAAAVSPVAKSVLELQERGQDARKRQLESQDQLVDVKLGEPLSQLEQQKVNLFKQREQEFKEKQVSDRIKELADPTSELRKAEEIERLRESQAFISAEGQGRTAAGLLPTLKARDVSQAIQQLPDKGLITRKGAETLLGGAMRVPGITSKQAEEQLRETQDVAFTVPEEVPIIGGKEIGTMDLGSTIFDVGLTVAQYGAINNALSGLSKTSKLGSLMNKSRLAKFGATQATDLLTDTIIQAPREFMNAVDQDDSLDQLKKDFLKNRGVDILLNLAIGGASEAIQSLKNLKASKQIEIVDLVEDSFKALPDSAAKQTLGQELGVFDDVIESGTYKIGDDIYEVTDTLNASKTGRLARNQLGDETFIPLETLKEDAQLIKLKADEIPGGAIRQVDETPIPDVARPEKPQSFYQRRSQRPDVEAAKVDRPFVEDEGISMTVEAPGGEAVRRTQDGQLERGFSRNVRTDVAMEPAVNASFDDNPLFYEQLANKTTLEKAQARFDRGYEEAIKDFDRTKSEFKADNVVLSRLIANEAAVRGDLDTMRRVIADTADTLTQAGQYSQAAKILRESNDPATILEYLQKEIDKLNTQGRKRYGPRRKKLIRKGETGWQDIKLTDDEVGMIAKMGPETSDADKQILFEDLFRSISEKIPSTKREKLDAWRRIAMLTNPKTHVRNIVGNTIQATVKRVADTEAAALEKFIPKDQRTKSVFVSRANKDIASDYWAQNAKDLSEGSRWEIFGVKSPFAEKKIFDTNQTRKLFNKSRKKIDQALEAVNEFSKATLEAEDIFFLKNHFIRDLGGFMQARGLKEPTQEAVEYALRRAQEATFRQQNALADIIAKGKQSRYGILVEAAVPFSKTPANIAQTGIDYSPIGVVKALGQLATNQPPAQFIETLTKGLTGTGLAATGFYMAMNGTARGKYRSDPDEEALLTRMGILPNSIQFKNGSYTIDWAQPAAIPYFMGVAFAEELKQKDDASTTEKILRGGVKGISTIFDQTMLRGITDLFGSYDAEGIVENIAGLPLDYVAQLLPTLGGQITRSLDPVRRERDYSGVLAPFESQVRSKTPGVSLTEPAKRGIFGEELRYGEGLGNVFQQFISPGFVGTAQGDELTEELYRLYQQVGSGFLPRAKVKRLIYKNNNYPLNAEERSEFQRIMGEYTERELRRLIRSSDYRNMSDDEKAKVIKSINDDGYDLAKDAFLTERGLK